MPLVMAAKLPLRRLVTRLFEPDALLLCLVFHVLYQCDGGLIKLSKFRTHQTEIKIKSTVHRITMS
jgi:hypothetical protein